MIPMLIFAHLLGDYILQFDFLARWKARSLWGVVAHGGIVTLTTLACAGLVDPGWWRYAALIGVTHTCIDVVRARLIHAKSTTWDLIYYLVDQVIHIGIIILTVTLRPVTAAGGHAVASKVLALAIGYLLLLQPAWVLLRFIVRGVWGAEAAPHLGVGEKYAPMIERVLIASFVLIGQVALVPLVLVPRRLTAIHLQENGVGVMMQLTSHWAETALSVLLAVGVGLILRLVMQGS
ncbi:MAG: DUF3307 domain-containing protein [Anaerolineae bacterium]